jgi:hypothetical protein
VELLGLFFMVYDIDIHELNLGSFKDLKFLDEISLKNVCLLHFEQYIHNYINNNNNNLFLFLFLRKKLLPYQRRGDFTDGH